ncbi:MULTISPECIES: hypothetical protein [Legionella]|nr:MULTISPECIES: hypothetical protein [Legionella]
MKKPIPSIDKTGYTRQLYYTLHQLNIQKTKNTKVNQAGGKL